jgi:hypothetical protein
MISYLGILLLSIVLEFIVVIATRCWHRSLRQPPVLATCLFLNLLTHPLATIARTFFAVPILPLEMVVILVEAIGYRQIARLPRATSMCLSLLANVVSMLAGLIFVL